MIGVTFSDGKTTSSVSLTPQQARGIALMLQTMTAIGGTPEMLTGYGALADMLIPMLGLEGES